MKVSLRAMLLAAAMAVPAWTSVSADEGLSIRFIGGEAYDATATPVSYNNMELAIGAGCAAPAGCAAAAPTCGADPACGTDAACGADSCDSCGDYNCDFGPFLPCKSWTVFAGAPIMVRQNYHDGLIYSGAIPADPQDDVLVAPNAGLYSGFQLNAIKHRDNGRDIEFGILTMGNGGPTSLDVLFGPAVLPPIGDLGDVSAVLSNYNSSVLSFEGNIRFRQSDWFSWLAGVRFISLNEDLYFVAVGDDAAALGMVTADNSMFGGQVGASIVLAQHNRWTWSGVFHAGIYYNEADVTVAGFLDPVPVFASGNNNPLALEADAQLAATCWLSDNFGIRIGYQVMWMDGVALAPSQVAALTSPVSVDPDTTSTPFWHGALVQGEFVW